MYDSQGIQNIEMNYDIRLKMGQIRCQTPSSRVVALFWKIQQIKGNDRVCLHTLVYCQALSSVHCTHRQISSDVLVIKL